MIIMSNDDGPISPSSMPSTPKSPLYAPSPSSPPFIPKSPAPQNDESDEPSGHQNGKRGGNESSI